ncbi:MAG: hypothetical protein AAFO77_13860 [Pseudomonadota bacterium]
MARRARVQPRPSLPRNRAASSSAVFVDAPCSGSGTWRRTPEAKWALTPARLAELQRMQKTALEDAARFVRPGGRLVYATCSIFQSENIEQIEWFIQGNSSFDVAHIQVWPVDKWGDGFFSAHLTQRA